MSCLIALPITLLQNPPLPFFSQFLATCFPFPLCIFFVSSYSSFILFLSIVGQSCGPPPQSQGNAKHKSFQAWNNTLLPPPVFSLLFITESSHIPWCHVLFYICCIKYRISPKRFEALLKIFV